MVAIPCLDSSDSESDSSDSESGTSRWGFSHRDSMRTTRPNKAVKSGQSTAVRFTRGHKGMRATLRAHFSLRIAKFDTLPNTL